MSSALFTIPFPSGSPREKIWRPGWSRKVFHIRKSTDHITAVWGKPLIPLQCGRLHHLVGTKGSILDSSSCFTAVRESGDHCPLRVTCNHRRCAHFVIKEVGTHHICQAYSTPHCDTLSMQQVLSCPDSATVCLRSHPNESELRQSLDWWQKLLSLYVTSKNCSAN
jgi:hypothetical protein